MNGGSVATIRRARYGSMNRGLLGQKIRPIARAPAATAACASSARVMPQILISIYQNHSTQSTKNDLKKSKVIPSYLDLCNEFSQRRTWITRGHEPFTDQECVIPEL